MTPSLFDYAAQAERDARATGGTKRLPKDRRSIDERAAEFIEKHGDVVELLADLAMELKANGAPRWSIDALFHVVRYRHFTSAHGARLDGYTLNNDYTAPIARHIMERWPALDGFFETRARKREKCSTGHAPGCKS